MQHMIEEAGKQYEHLFIYLIMISNYHEHFLDDYISKIRDDIYDFLK